jgi:hypothetical protein
LDLYQTWPHDSPLEGEEPYLFGVIRSKVKVTYYKYNFWQQDRFHTITLVLYIGSLPMLATWFPCGRGRTLFILGSFGQRSRSPLLWIKILTTGPFPHDNFSSVYWILTKLGHMITLWKGKNPIYFEVFTIIFDNLYRRAYFVMHTFLVIPPLVERGLYCNHFVHPLVHPSVCQSVHTFVTDISASTGRNDFIFDMWLWHGDLYRGSPFQAYRAS